MYCSKCGLQQMATFCFSCGSQLKTKDGTQIKENKRPMDFDSYFESKKKQGQAFQIKIKEQLLLKRLQCTGRY